MQECSHCQSFIEDYAPLKLTVKKLGDEVWVYAENKGKHIILIKRMLLCGEFDNGYSMVYIREGGGFDFEIGGARLEQGSMHLKFRINWPNVLRAQAEAEYIEIIGRCRSECTQF